LSHHLVSCLELFHNVQKERGLATLYLGSKGELVSIGMKSQFALTDMAAEKIRDILRHTRKLPPLLRSLQALPGQREYIAAHYIKPSDAVSHYTDNLITPALDLALELMISNTRNGPAKISALTYLLQWKESLGQQREVGIQMTVPGWHDDFDLVHRLQNLINEQQAYKRLFLGLADETQRQILSATKGDEALIVFCDDINDSIMAGNRPVSALRTFAASDWYAIFSAKMDMLHIVAKELAEQLTDENSDPVVIAPANQPLDPEVEGYFEILKSLPLFKGINIAVLRSLLRPARVAPHDKGSLIVMQGEPAARFYIILDGWVKIFRGTAEGEEAILEILGKREVFLDTDILNAGPSPVSVRAVTKARLLAIPANTFRDHIVRHKDLALNALMTSSRHTQRRIDHFEQLTLRTATQRVGRFFLDLCLETGLDGRPINLPFDKSLIAAWLNIKPETFSRILQTFRANGFRIDRHQIILPEPFALCDFCDSETACQCDLDGTGACPNKPLQQSLTG